MAEKAGGEYSEAKRYRNTKGGLNMESLLFIIAISAVIYLASVVWHAGGEKEMQRICNSTEKNEYYSVLEKHEDGAWWWHPWLNRQPYSTPQEAEERFQRVFPDKERTHVVFAHQKPFNLETSVCTLDFVNFHFSGYILWSSEGHEGTPIPDESWISNKNKDTIILISTIQN